VSAQGSFVATVAVCLLNGLISPLLPLVWHLHPLWMPAFLPLTPEVVFYGASLIVATATLLLAALPAAIAEHAFGVRLERAMLVWLAAAVLLTLPGLR
jgi:heme/copper-type cytochrome/quinol oxidase subunit 3